MIKKIAIQNIGPFENAELNLKRGKTSIIGENGAGKTTLLKSLTMGLWGDSRYILDTKIGDFIKIGKDFGSVEIEFERNGIEYRIKRRWNRSGRNKAKLETPQGTITSITAVTEKVEEIFGMPYKNWLDISWARQGEIKELLNGDKEVFDRLLGIADLENSWKRLGTIKSFVKSEREAKETIVQELAKGINNESDIERRKKERVKKCEEIKEEMDNIVLIHEHEDISEKIRFVEVEARTLMEENRKLKDIPKEGGTCPTCGQEVSKEHRRTIEDQIKDNVERIDELARKSTLLKKEQNKFEEEKRENDQKERKIIELKSDLKNNREFVAELKMQLDRIEDTKKDLLKFKKELDDVKKELAMIETMRGAYRLAQPQLRTGRINKLKYGVLSLFEKMFGGRFSYFDIDEDYTMTVWEDGYERTTQTLSGGEGTALAIALRLSIVNEIASQELLILDEPTNHLDGDRVDQLVDLIDKITTNNQIIVVTHNDLITSASDDVINIHRELESSTISSE